MSCRTNEGRTLFPRGTRGSLIGFVVQAGEEKPPSNQLKPAKSKSVATQDRRPGCSSPLELCANAKRLRAAHEAASAVYTEGERGWRERLGRIAQLLAGPVRPPKAEIGFRAPDEKAMRSYPKPYPLAASVRMETGDADRLYAIGQLVEAARDLETFAASYVRKVKSLEERYGFAAETERGAMLSATRAVEFAFMNPPLTVSVPSKLVDEHLVRVKPPGMNAHVSLVGNLHGLQHALIGAEVVPVAPLFKVEAGKQKTSISLSSSRFSTADAAFQVKPSQMCDSLRVEVRFESAGEPIQYRWKKVAR